MEVREIGSGADTSDREDAVTDVAATRPAVNAALEMAAVAVMERAAMMLMICTTKPRNCRG